MLPIPATGGAGDRKAQPSVQPIATAGLCDVKLPQPTSRSASCSAGVSLASARSSWAHSRMARSRRLGPAWLAGRRRSSDPSERRRDRDTAPAQRARSHSHGTPARPRPFLRRSNRQRSVERDRRKARSSTVCSKSSASARLSPVSSVAHGEHPGRGSLDELLEGARSAAPCTSLTRGSTTKG